MKWILDAIKQHGFSSQTTAKPHITYDFVIKLMLLFNAAVSLVSILHLHSEKKYSFIWEKYEKQRRRKAAISFSILLKPLLVVYWFWWFFLGFFSFFHFFFSWKKKFVDKILMSILRDPGRKSNVWRLSWLGRSKAHKSEHSYRSQWIFMFTQAIIDHYCYQRIALFLNLKSFSRFSIMKEGNLWNALIEFFRKFARKFPKIIIKIEKLVLPV